MNISLENIASQVCDTILDAGSFIKSNINQLVTDDIETKGLHDYVTYVDKKSEKMLIDKLSLILPGSGFLVEEGTISNQKEEYTWIIDPLDGTTNFLHGLPLYSVSVALMHNNEVELGVVYEINQNECFYSWKGNDVYLNHKKTHVSNSGNLGNSLIATGFPYSDFSRLNPYLGVLNELIQNTRGIRRFGSAAVDLAYVACGRFEGFYEYGLHPWDVAAGSFLVKQAGGIVTDFKSNNNYLHGKEIIASNKKIHSSLHNIISKYFG